MNNRLSKLWLLGPPLVIALSLFVYYAMFSSFRGWVDSHIPWVAEHIGKHVPKRGGEEPVGAPGSAAARAEHPVGATPPPIPPAPTPPPVPVYITAAGVLDLAKLSANRADWPKSLILRNAKEFPAVVGGKVVGNVTAPASAEVHLVRIEQGKLGLEYRGGGAWASPDETDLADRLRNLKR